jgi:hypothetical protein
MGHTLTTVSALMGQLQEKIMTIPDPQKGLD